MTESNGEHASPLPPRIHTPTPPKPHSDQLRARLRTSVHTHKHLDNVSNSQNHTHTLFFMCSSFRKCSCMSHTLFISNVLYIIIQDTTSCIQVKRNPVSRS